MELRIAVKDLIRIVEGPEWRDWRDKNNIRLKDTPEFVNLYLAHHVEPENDLLDVQKQESEL